ncbi:Glycosidase [Granulicella pectinivorans]|uniref:Glycosidase n=1 Tax=Granulicella pectinivorans TaxID=474950 RepID=A0A1I6L258_9BACT|nr:alpha-amylase family glycosyl hydrolase [Granulicella pectinivorans]SFR97593.1 Glycosidase [Granulicella pectinivorans]
MEFHISRAARSRYGVDEALFDYIGNVVFADVLASRKLAQRMTEVRQAEDPAADVVNAGSLFAMGLIDELSHALIARYRENIDPDVLPAALQWFTARATPEQVESLLTAFTTQFPNVAVNRGDLTVADWLASSIDGVPNREAELEEMLLLWLANQNPAYKSFNELFNDSALAGQTIYKTATSTLPDYFATRPKIEDEGTLLDVLRAPMLASPDDLTGQLDYIREHWVPYIGEKLRAVLLAVDTLREEGIAIWMRHHPADTLHHAGFTEQGKPDYGMFGFSGDEYRGFEDLRTEREKRLAELAASGTQQPTVNEYEAFSTDDAWMPTVVLMAKSTYVWLEQLSKQYKRHIHRLDQIPQEELDTMAGRGMNGLWLIGLWERSVASQTIKRMRGQHDAVASAYSLRDYRIAEDLGGEHAYEVLRDRARRAGIRLASDMVPNHMGIDSTWVIEHPDWFVSRPESPFPVYRFEGPNLSPDSRVEIRIEDHYFDQTDAAVVFQLKQRNGHVDYVYHGNDGTTFAWNDTAQLDYSKEYVREQVIKTILEVAKLFPIIRFDAAMTLAKKHVQRLWFPLPGEGKSIPSRAENAMTNEEFDALMPHEFWREVVDRVAVEVPGTLLLAEAFWLLEGYFVRTLGMHRVYNSAFMNMLRDEENAKYRSYLKKTIEFDPDILKRYVNFMSNPDERTAIDQFGDGDKYFGCCTLMATLPGLPMFGHGQIEGYTERYGMEYKQAKQDEWPNEHLVARHQREIMPMLKDRSLFAESTYFRMYDFNTDHGVDENVFAFSNREGSRRAVILFNNAYQSTYGTIHWSVEQMDKASGSMHGETLGDAIRLPWGDDALIAYKDTASDLEFLRWTHELREQGITLPLRGYQYVVLLDWRELHATAAEPWDQLANALHGEGVLNLNDELKKLRLRTVEEAIGRLLHSSNIDRIVDAAHGDIKPETLEPIEHAATELFAAVKSLGETVAPPSSFAATLKAILALPLVKIPTEGSEVTHVLPMGRAAESSVQLWAPVLAYNILLHLAPKPAKRIELFDRLELRSALASAFAALGISHENTWRAAARVRLLLGIETTTGHACHQETFWSDPDVQWLAGFNESEGRIYFNKESVEQLFWWMSLPLLTIRPTPDDVIALQQQLRTLRTAAINAGYEAPVFIAALKQTKPVATAPLPVAAIEEKPAQPIPEKKVLEVEDEELHKLV